MDLRRQRRGFFVTFEGPEGSGKSSQARGLAAALRRRGKTVVAVRDPGSTVLGQRLRRVLLHTDLKHCSPKAEAMLFVAGRVALVDELIRPALGRGAVVVCDRFHDSTVAYQGYAGQLDPTWLQRLGRDVVGDAMPDLTVLLDLPVADGFARQRRSPDRMERKALAFHERVRQAYRRLARREPGRFLVLDATQSQQHIHRQILEAVLKRLIRKSG